MLYDELSVVAFLTFLYNNGLGYSSINTARCALSTILINYHGATVGSSALVKRFVKGIFELRPPIARYEYIWDVNIVLEYLKNFSPDEDLPLDMLTYKLVMLMALSSKQRVQTIQAITIENIKFFDNVVIIPIRSLIKTSNARKYKFALELKKYSDPSICILHTLRVYLNKTSEIRGSYKQLFVSFLKPFKPVSKDTISRWIKLVLFEAGIDTTIFKAHSTRSASCSAAKRDNVPLDLILQSAGWSSCQTFRKYYDRVIVNKSV